MISIYYIVYWYKDGVGWVSVTNDLGFQMKFESEEQAKWFVHTDGKLNPGNTQVVEVVSTLCSDRETREQFRTRTFMLV